MVVLWCLTAPGGRPVLAASEEDEALRVASVQLEITEETAVSAFELERQVRSAVEEAAENDADLVVFPEYVNVFLPLRWYGWIIRRAESLDEAFARLPHEGSRNQPRETLQRILKQRAKQTRRQVHRLWSELAERFDIAIIAGTYFAQDHRGELRNRALVFDNRGRLIYEQDKAFLTSFERDVFDLEAGSVHDADTFEIAGTEFALTICRDSFFEVWEDRFDDADVWIELRANGERYSEEVRERFEGALPERVARTTVPVGVNSSLTGEFLDLVWEGPSYAVEGSGRRLVATEDVRGTEVLMVRIEQRQSPGSDAGEGAEAGTGAPMGVVKRPGTLD